MQYPAPNPETEQPTALAAHIIHAVREYRFLTSPQLARLLAQEPDSAEQALRRLVAAGFLAGIRRPVLTTETPDTVYALAQRGADFVAGRLGIDRRLVRWRKYHNQVGLPFLEHRLAVNDVRIALMVGGCSLGYSLEDWRYELPIREDVDDPDEGVPPLVLRPDAYVCFLCGPRRLHFFLEVDMATETHARFAQKVRRYLAYKESRLFRYRLGGRAFRVLTVAPTASRVLSLRRVAEREGAQRAFWFATLSDVTADAVSLPIWRVGGEDGRASLVGSGERRSSCRWRQR